MLHDMVQILAVSSNSNIFLPIAFINDFVGNPGPTLQKWRKDKVLRNAIFLLVKEQS